MTMLQCMCVLDKLKVIVMFCSFVCFALILGNSKITPAILGRKFETVEVELGMFYNVCFLNL